MEIKYDKIFTYTLSIAHHGRIFICCVKCILGFADETQTVSELLPDETEPLQRDGFDVTL